MFTFLTKNTLGRLLATFLISMVPIVELRGGLPYGIALGLLVVIPLQKKKKAVHCARREEIHIWI